MSDAIEAASTLQTRQSSVGALRLEPTMGTIVTLDVRDSGLPRAVLDAALDAAATELHNADRVFSTYAQDSDISRLRAGRVSLNQCASEVQEVLELCARAKQHTDGWFDPWAMPGGVDPTGLVKGWAARQALRTLTAHGVRHAMVNAAGDLIVMGNASGADDDTGWRIAVTDPGHPRRALEVLEVSGRGVATSAAYERGPLSLDPHNQRTARRLASATVTAPDLAMADAYATAAVAQGPAALEWLTQLPGVSAVLLTLEGCVLRSGPARHRQQDPTGPPDGYTSQHGQHGTVAAEEREATPDAGRRRGAFRRSGAVSRHSAGGHHHLCADLRKRRWPFVT